MCLIVWKTIKYSHLFDYEQLLFFYPNALRLYSLFIFETVNYYHKKEMKKHITFIALLLLSLTVKNQIVYHDASVFPLLGKATQNTATRYERLPDSLRNISRKPLWDLGQNSVGLAIRFSSNSATIAAKWNLLLNRELNNMSPTGVKGLDLYCLQNGKWVFVNSGRPTGKSNTTIIITNMKPEEREYMLYLPLYDKVTSLSIGVDSLSEITQPAVNLPVREKPVVFYGTSILQGCSASRPGMAHCNILSRWLNRETINLGFSGNGLLDLEIAEVMDNVDVSMFVLDFVPNVTVEKTKERADKFYKIIRNRHLETPILFIEDPIFTHTHFDQRIAKEVKDKNETLNTFFETLKKR